MVEFLRKNIVWMVVSLAMATALWAIVTNQQNPPGSEYFPSVPVRVKGEPAGLVVRDEARPVGVKVSAPSDVLKRLSTSGFEAYVDASKSGPGVQDLPVRVEHSDPRVRIEEVQPSKATLRLEALVHKEVPVKANLVGSVPFGFSSKAVRVSPEQVVVAGAQSLVARVVLAAVEVKLEGVRSSISQPFRASPQTADGEDMKAVTVQPESVIVEVPVEREVGYKTVPVAPRVVGTVGLGYQIVGIMVEPTAVTVVGDPLVLGELMYLPTRPIEVGGSTGDITVVVEPEMQEGVSLARRQTLTARVYVSPVESSQIVRIAPVLRGLGSDLQAAVSPNAVEITVSGPMPALSRMKPQDIGVVVDASGLLTGTYSLSPTVTAPSAIRLDAVVPNKLAVTIR